MPLSQIFLHPLCLHSLTPMFAGHSPSLCFFKAQRPHWPCAKGSIRVRCLGPAGWGISLNLLLETPSEKAVAICFIPVTHHLPAGCGFGQIRAVPTYDTSELLGMKPRLKAKFLKRPEVGICLFVCGPHLVLLRDYSWLSAPRLVLVVCMGPYSVWEEGGTGFLDYYI